VSRKRTLKPARSRLPFPFGARRSTEYDFVLEVEGTDIMEPTRIDALVSACGDVLVGRFEGKQLIDMSRRAESLIAAVHGAIRDVSGAVPEAHVVSFRLAPDTLGQPGIAAEIVSAARHPKAVALGRPIDKTPAARAEIETYAFGLNVLLHTRHYAQTLVGRPASILAAGLKRHSDGS
jgi:hypothetical protein